MAKGNYDPNESPEALAARLAKIREFVDAVNPPPSPDKHERFVQVPASLLTECRRLMLFAEYTQESSARRRDATNAANEIVRYLETTPSATPRRDAHSLEGELDTKLLRAFTPAKTAAPGFEIEYWNLTMVRMKGDVVLTVRLPSQFSHYVQTAEGRMAAWHPGAVSSVRFTRELWPSFVEQVAEASNVFKACDELDAIP